VPAQSGRRTNAAWRGKRVPKIPRFVIVSRWAPSTLRTASSVVDYEGGVVMKLHVGKPPPTAQLHRAQPRLRDDLAGNLTERCGFRLCAPGGGPVFIPSSDVIFARRGSGGSKARIFLSDHGGVFHARDSYVDPRKASAGGTTSSACRRLRGRLTVRPFFQIGMMKSSRFFDLVCQFQGIALGAVWKSSSGRAMTLTVTSLIISETLRAVLTAA